MASWGCEPKVERLRLPSYTPSHKSLDENIALRHSKHLSTLIITSRHTVVTSQDGKDNVKTHMCESEIVLW